MFHRRKKSSAWSTQVRLECQDTIGAVLGARGSRGPWSSCPSGGDIQTQNLYYEEKRATNEQVAGGRGYSIIKSDLGRPL